MIDREKLKEKLRMNNQRLMERARNLVRSTAEDEDLPAVARSVGPHRPEKKAKIMDVYKMESHYNYRSSSFVDRREQAVQTKVEDRPTTVRRTGSIMINMQTKTPEGFKNSLVAGRGSGDRGSRNKTSKQIEIDAFSTPAIQPEPEKKLNVVDLEPDKRQEILNSQTFGEYFGEASKFIEKIIGQDGTGAAKRPQKFDKIVPQVETELLIELPVSFKSAVVSQVAWSPLIQDLFLTVYSEPVDAAVYDKLLIWNVNFKHRPEFELYSNSKIQTAVFSPFSTEIIVAGLESGRVCIYDLRAKKEPVVKSGISSDAHKTQITGLQYIGTANSSHLVTTSEEGRLCIWPSGLLDAPRKVDMLYQEKKENVEDYAFASEPLCISAIPGDVGSVYVGTSDAKIYQCITESAQLDQAQRFYSQAFTDHGAVVSAVHMSPLNTSATELSGLMVSGSLDWTVKLWNPKNTKPIATFEYFKDPVSDVHWNHAHTGVFAAASVNGSVAIYDLMNDFENPSITFDLGDCVLNSKWDPAGKMLAISDNSGRVNIKKFRGDAFVHGPADVENLETTIRYQNR